MPGSELERLGLPVLGFRLSSDFPIPASTFRDCFRFDRLIHHKFDVMTGT